MSQTEARPRGRRPTFFLEAMERLETLIEPVVGALGLELVEATFGKEGGRSVLRVFVDREGGVDLETIAEASRKVSRRLDVEDFGRGSYTLEVSSPGLERRLRKPADFTTRVGQKVKVKTYEAIEGSKSHVGSILAADDETVRVGTDAGERVIAYEKISSARTVFEWGSGR